MIFQIFSLMINSQFNQYYIKQSNVYEEIPVMVQKNDLNNEKFVRNIHLMSINTPIPIFCENCDDIDFRINRPS